jgi:hypothetical protein
MEEFDILKCTFTLQNIIHCVSYDLSKGCELVAKLFFRTLYQTIFLFVNHYFKISKEMPHFGN